MNKAGMGSHTRPNEGETNTWLTPKHIIDALGPFDLDPCAGPSPRPWPTAKRHIELPQNGLLSSWDGPCCRSCARHVEAHRAAPGKGSGAEEFRLDEEQGENCEQCAMALVEKPYRVYLNPPYGRETDAWLQRMSTHRFGIALIFARTETATWQQWVWPYAHSVFFLDGRLWFHRADGTRGDSNAGGPSALISYSPFDTEAILVSGLDGVLVNVQSRTGRFAGNPAL